MSHGGMESGSSHGGMESGNSHGGESSESTTAVESKSTAVSETKENDSATKSAEKENRIEHTEAEDAKHTEAEGNEHTEVKDAKHTEAEDTKHTKAEGNGHTEVNDAKHTEIKDAEHTEVKEVEKRVDNGKLPEVGTKLEASELERVEQEDKEIKQHFEDFINERWGDDPQELESKKELISKINEMSKDRYEQASAIAQRDPNLRYFSDHTANRHTLQVTESTLYQMDQYKEAVREHPEQWSDILTDKTSENTTIYATLLHDSSMAGRVGAETNAMEDYERRVAENDEFSSRPVGEQIRKEHSIESAMYALSQRSQVEELNKNLDDKINVDEAAMLIALHSKSAEVGGGENAEGISVKDLSNKESILAYADAMKREAAAHNLTFDDGFLYKTNENGERVIDEEAIKRVTTEAAALRQGDSFRPAAEFQTTQSNRILKIDATESPKNANSMKEELAPVELAYYDREGNEITEMRVDENNTDLTPASAEITKKYAVGEKNISRITPGEVSGDGSLVTDVELVDGNFCPFTTGDQIAERMLESASLSGKKMDSMVYRIKSEVPLSEDAKKNMEKGITDRLPLWAKEEAKADGSFVHDESSDPKSRIRIEFV